MPIIGQCLSQLLEKGGLFSCDDGDVVVGGGGIDCHRSNCPPT